MKRYKLVLLFFLFSSLIMAAEYRVGIGDIIEVSILQPEKITNSVTVSPSGEISVPYIGSIKVKGLTISQIQLDIEHKLAQGIFRTPVVSVTLIESRSRTFTITGAVNRPGTLPLIEGTTVLKAVTMAGWFTKFANQDKVKVLRPRKNRPGYNYLLVNIEKILNGEAQADILLQPGDIVVVPE